MSTDAAPHPDDVGLCHQIMEEQQATISGLQQRMQQLEHYVEQLLRSKYGPRSERVDPNQLQLFDAAATTAEAPASTAGETDAVVVTEHRRRGGGRNKLPAHLPRETVEHDLPEAQKSCPGCGAQRQRIGCETSEQLEFVPAVLKVLEHVRWKYACRTCQEYVAVAPPADKPLEKGLPGPGRGGQVCRPPAAVPAGGRVRPRRRGAVPQHAVPLGTADGRTAATTLSASD